MRCRPQITCHTRGSRTMARVIASANGCGYSVTDDCHAAAPWKAARLFQRWRRVHTPSGKTASAEPRRSAMKLARLEVSDPWLATAELTRWDPYHRSGLERRLLEPDGARASG